MLVDLAAHAELFHTSTGTAYADLVIDGHRETWPVRSARFRGWLRRCYYEATRSAPSAAALNSALNLLDARAQFEARNGRSTSASPSTTATFISISLTRRGVRSRSGRTDGGSLRSHRCASIGPPGCWRCRCRGQKGRSMSLRHSSTCRTEMTVYLSRHGSWPRCVTAALSAPGDRGRAGIGKDSTFKAVARVGRSECCSGPDPAAGGARSLHRRQQWPCARI
jgi:hypothetical protein